MFKLANFALTSFFVQQKLCTARCVSDGTDRGHMSEHFDLKGQEITVSNIGRNLPPARLYEEAIRYDAEHR